MSNFDNMYHDFFGMKNQTNEADLLNKLTDYRGGFLYKLLEKLEKFNIEVLANSSLNLSGDPTCFDLIDTLLVSARQPLKYILTDFALLESIR